MSDEDFIRKMRARVDQCRRLATGMTDDYSRKILLQMADEAEADLHKYLADHGDQDNCLLDANGVFAPTGQRDRYTP